jgi:hypothetical protein
MLSPFNGALRVGIRAQLNQAQYAAQFTAIELKR